MDITVQQLIAEGVRPADAWTAICIRDAARNAIATDLDAMRAMRASEAAIEARQTQLLAALDDWLQANFQTLRDRARDVYAARQAAVDEAKRCVG
jgi:hypothetical protein